MDSIGRVAAPVLEKLLIRDEARLAAIRSGWSQLVGETLATRTRPVRLDGDALLVASEGGAWAKAVAEMVPSIEARFRRVLPEARVDRIRLLPRR